MSSIQRHEDSATELRLDYDDISSGQLVIVIQGLPTNVGNVLNPAAALGLKAVSTAKPTDRGRVGTPSSSLMEATSAINDAVGYAPVLVTSLVLAAWRGQEARASELIAATVEDASAEDQPRASALADYARAILFNGLGHYRSAFEAARRACAHEILGSFAWALVELVEAGARSNDFAVASEALSRLDELAQVGGADGLPGVRARSAALLSEGVEAERLYRESIALLRRSRISVHLARAQLVYGEWLRRENRRVDARVQLRAAHDAFDYIGADAFAERTFHELLATGETARRRTDVARADLTPQEAQIARLARDGFTNTEIGTQLFISPRTVEYHLRKVFQKLNITSRTHLVRVSPGRLGLA